MYTGALAHQLDGSRYAHQNCVLACGTGMMDTHSMAYYRVSPSSLRTQSGDTVGGVSYDQLISVVKKVTNGEVVLVRLYFAPSSTLVDLLDDPRDVTVSIDAGVTVNTAFATGNFTGGHSVRAVAHRYYSWVDSSGVKRSQHQVLVGDPGTSKDMRWWPLALLLKAAVARTGNRGIHVVFTRDVEGVGRVARAVGNVRASASTTSSDKGDLKAGTLYPVISTVKGGAWTTESGHRGTGWAKIKWGTSFAYAAGGLLK